VGRLVDVDDLVDAADVAAILGLAQSNTVHTYARRYAEMPAPVLDRGPNRSKLWLRTEILAWARTREK
jgi:hypothetical protein